MGTLLMKGIIYTSQIEAENDLILCNSLPQGESTTVGNGIHVTRENPPYTYIIKHPSENQWCIVSNLTIEQLLDKTSEELNSTWFNNSMN